MESLFTTLPANIKDHLRTIAETAGLEEGENSLELITKNWIEKRDLFDAQVRALDMADAPDLPAGDGRGALMLTCSGSLVGLGCLRGDDRWMEYYSIKLRADVPDAVKTEATSLRGDARMDGILEFTAGALRSTSPLYRIALCREGVPPDEQETRIRAALLFLTNGFARLNRSLGVRVEDEDGLYTMKGIIGQIARRNGMTQKQVRTILDDYIGILESGMLMGERVPLGRVGRLYLKMRPARKARVGRNIATGEDMTIGARPVMAVPKIVFSSHMKEIAAGVVLPGTEEDACEVISR